MALRPIAAVARLEGGFFARYPKLLVATLVVALVPNRHTLICLSSVWDPASYTQALLSDCEPGPGHAVSGAGDQHRPGGHGASATAGTRSASRLVATKPRYANGYGAGAGFCTLLIPPDLQFNAVPGAARAGRLVVLLRPRGNNYQELSWARRFADDLGHAVAMTAPTNDAGICQFTRLQGPNAVWSVCARRG